MNDITMTLSSPEVPLVEGKGSLSVSVTNAAAVSQRIVLGAFPATNGAEVAPAADGAASAASTAGPPIATVDRPLRTVGAGATEQYVVSFDVSTSAPGQHVVRLIGYSADRAPEEYADQAQTVTLTVEAKAAPVKKFPWWIVIVGGAILVALAIAAVIFVVTRPPQEQILTWIPSGPANVEDASPENWYVLLQAKDCAGLSASGVEADPLWAAASALCDGVVGGVEASSESAVADFATLTEPDPDDCLQHVTWTLLERFATISKDHPDASVTVVEGTGTACPLGFAGVTVNGASTVVQETSGTTAGGTTLRLIGRLEAPVVVRFGSDSIAATELGENNFTIATPPGPANEVHIIQVESGGAAIPGAVLFSYVEPGDPPWDPCLSKPKVCEIFEKDKLPRTELFR